MDGTLPAGPLFLTDSDVRAVFSWPEGIAALREAYAQEERDGRYPPRSMARGDGLWLRTMTGVADETGLVGAKLITANLRKRFASYLIALLDQESTALVALLDAASVTGLRTAATSAIAAQALTVEGPLRVAVIGSGFEAKTHLRALAAVREVALAKVFSPNPASRSRFVEELSDIGIAIDDTSSAFDAVTGADLVICAARSRDESPTFLGEWMVPGMTVVSIGSTLPEQRELDAESIRRADLIVADMMEEVEHDTGDMLDAARQGVSWEGRLVSLSAVVSGRHPGRTSSDQIIIYKSVGGAIQDLAVAALCVRRARDEGIGTLLPVTIEPLARGRK